MTNNTLLGSVPVDLMYQALETEKGGVQIYSTALRLAINKDLREEWNKYLEQTKNHVQVLSNIITSLGLDPDTETPGRKVVRYIGTSLVKAMELASRCADPQAAQIVAAECVVHAETKDHLNWELLGELAKNANAEESALLMPAYEQVEQEEDEHLYHTTGWTRELWIQALKMPAVLPPPEETQKVDNAIEAAQAKKSRTANAKASANGKARKASAR
jgi:ferritin-like metal-binding protein YciE